MVLSVNQWINLSEQKRVSLSERYRSLQYIMQELGKYPDFLPLCINFYKVFLISTDINKGEDSG